MYAKVCKVIYFAQILKEVYIPSILIYENERHSEINNLFFLTQYVKLDFAHWEVLFCPSISPQSC